MFPTTIWSTIRDAGSRDPNALERFAEQYRAPVLSFVRSRGFRGPDAEDLCQEVFVRVLAGRVLERADARRGRFRSLLHSVTTHVIQDRLRRRRDEPALEREPSDPGPDRDPEFDRAWILHLAGRALGRLREQGSPYYEVLRGHLDGAKQDRNRLWIARGKLQALVRDEVAQTCSSPEELEDELALLSPYLRPSEKVRDAPPRAAN